jgi:hypothetical protein
MARAITVMFRFNHLFPIQGFPLTFYSPQMPAGKLNCPSSAGFMERLGCWITQTG